MGRKTGWECLQSHWLCLCHPGSFSLAGMRIIFPATAHIYTPIPLLDLLVSVVFKEDIPMCFSQAQQLPEEFCYATVPCVVRFASFQHWVTMRGPHFC